MYTNTFFSTLKRTSLHSRIPAMTKGEKLQRIDDLSDLISPQSGEYPFEIESHKQNKHTIYFIQSINKLNIASAVHPSSNNLRSLVYLQRF